MDMFRQKRNLITTIVILVIMNFITLFILWLGKPTHNIIQGSKDDGTEKVRMQEMLKAELGFSNDQAEQFLALRKNHQENTMRLDDELMQVKNEMLEEAMYSNAPSISDSLLNLSLEKQGQLELITFQHFQKLKQICTHEQREKLFELVHRLIGPRQRRGPPQGNRPDGPPPEGRRDGPPPGEMREGRPPPPNRN